MELNKFQQEKIRESNSTVYNSNIIIDIEFYGELSIEKMNQSLIRYINDHVVFNSNIMQSANGYIWSLRPKLDSNCKLIQYFPSLLSDKQIFDLINEPMSIEVDLLTRYYVIKIDNAHYRFINVIHEVILNRNCVNDLLLEYSMYYNNNDYKCNVTLEDQLIILNQLKDCMQPYEIYTQYVMDKSNLDFNFLYTTTHTHQDASENTMVDLSIPFPQKDIPTINQSCVNENTSFFKLQQIALAILIHEYTEEKEIVIDTKLEEVEKYRLLLGCNYHKIQTRIIVNSDISIPDLIKAYDVYKNEVASDCKIIDKQIENVLDVKYPESANVVFNQDEIKFSEIEKLKINQLCEKIVDFPIFLYKEVKDDELLFKIKFDNIKYDHDLIEHFLNNYVYLLNRICIDLANNIHRKIGEYGVINPTALNDILFKWNDTLDNYPEDKTIIQLFEDQAKSTPNNLAVNFENISLNYDQLNIKANKLSHFLIGKYEIQPEDFVPLCIERSEHMIIAILAILKSGAAYVPMDTEYPNERIEYILSDTKPKVVIISKKLLSKFESLKTKCDFIVIEETQYWKDYVANNPKVGSKPTNLAYMIYTSGTTGNPKGVMIENKSLVNRITWMNKCYQIKEEDRVLQKTPYTFDVSVWELFWPICYGACMIFAKPNGHKDSIYLASMIKSKHISIIHFVPSMLNVFEETIADNSDLCDSCQSLRYIFCSGEALNLASVQIANKIFPKTQIHNLYGPTEATIDVLYYDCSKNISKIYIGRPISNTTAYILNKDLKPVPLGVVGELYIGGDGVARGYFNLPELTRERFINNPFCTEVNKKNRRNERIYKTGDLAKYSSDGNIEYIGRNDFQVKIRGFRIELGEIESLLSGLPDIKQVIVSAKTNSSGNKYLIAYYTSDYELSEKFLTDNLRESLPEYMIPSFYIHLDEFPVTSNGKLDRKSLPEPSFSRIANYISPTSDIEKDLCCMFSEILGVRSDVISVSDDFFKLGGDSISSIQLVNKIKQRINVRLTVKDIFSYRTIQQLCGYITSTVENERSSMSEHGLLEGSVKLLPIQEWFFDMKDKGLLPDYNYFNHSFMINTPMLDLVILKKSICRLIEYHDALRLRFTHDLINNKYVQEYSVDIPDFEIETLNISDIDKDITDYFIKWQNDFDIFKGNIFKFGYVIGFPNNQAKIYIAVHHLAIDAVSWRILKDDLAKLYNYYSLNGNQANNSVEEILGLKATSYRQWSIKINDKYSEQFPDEKKYWEHSLKDMATFNSFFISKRINEVITNTISFDHETTLKLIRNVNSVYNTSINDILLTALSLSLAKITGLNNNYILLEGHGREDVWDDVDIMNTVGWFTSMFPVKLDYTGDDIASNIVTVKEILKNVPRNGIGFGPFYGYTIAKPAICFNYLGQFDNLGTQNKNWSIYSGEHIYDMSSSNQLSEVITINGAIYENQLLFSFIGYIAEPILERLLLGFKENLINIIEYLSMQTRCYLTVSDIDNVISRAYLDKLQKEKDIENVYLANSLQQGFIYHAINQGNIDDAYIVQVAWEYHNDLNIDLLKESWGKAQSKYESLRIRFAWEEELVQIIDKESQLRFIYKDLTSLNSQEQNKYLIDLYSHDRDISFDLQTGALFRIYLIKLSNQLYNCLFSSHHAILDGWSIPLLINFVHDTYIKLVSGRKSEDFKDYTYGLSQKYLQTTQCNDQKYWKEQIELLDDKEDLSSLVKPELKGQLNLSEYKHIKEPKEKSVIFNKKQYSELKSFCNQWGCTINTLFQYCWHKQLSIYGNTQTTVVGTVVAGRNIPIDNIDQSIGLYINTLPVILEHKSQPVIEQLKILQVKINEVNTKNDVNLASLSLEGERLFNSLFVFEKYPSIEDQNESEDLNVHFTCTVEKLDYPLAVVLFEHNAELHLSIKYASELFSDSMLEQLLEGIKLTLDEILNCPTINTCNIKNLTENKFREIVLEWNRCKQNYLSNQSIIQLFEERVKANPNNTAIVYEGKTLTYYQLNEKANQLANYLIKEYNVQFDDLIVLCLDRSEYMIIGILAVLKSGAAYVPVNPQYPEERISYILSDTKAQVVISEKLYEKKLKSISDNINIVSANEDKLMRNFYSSENPHIYAKPENIAYVIYTSGTTGMPKGVMVMNKNVCRLFAATAKWFCFDEKDVWTLFHSYTFDFSVWEIWGALLYGGKLVIPSKEEILDLNLFFELCIKQGVTILNQTPNAFYQFMDIAISRSELLLKLRFIIFGGEALNLLQLKPWYKHYQNSGPTLINMYGITETTVHVTYKKIDPYELDRGSLIGIPIDDLTTYVLDSNANPLPIGAIGELYVGGAGVALGYLNRPQLTRERFVVNPFQTENEKEKNINNYIYKTGDLVRRLSNNNYEYIGRNDFQVKVRGYRIELGEIEMILSSYPNIKRSVVLAKKICQGQTI